ncbi:ABC-2 type transporter-domain-containing protein [Scheffersomyces xylosifermentans]|uniref:ABC-2 type transporter-domain-containing protein n=1 Tax=Scheffersomyces xylosifermentans TaxID=1304137 RepID=UPI00315C86C6
MSSKERGSLETDSVSDGIDVFRGPNYGDGREAEELNDEQRRLELVQTVTDLRSPEVLDRLEELSHQLSTHTVRDGKIVIDPEDFDLHKILANFVYLASNQGIRLRESGVSFVGLSVFGVDESFALVPTVVDLLKGPIGAIEAALSRRKSPDRTILDKIDGLAKPGEMVLVLGRPGAGCSSFLKTLSGTDLDLFKSVEGDIRYDGITQETMLKHFKSELIYNPELDNHFPHLTVEQTLKFAIACKTPNIRINGISRDEFINAMKEILATVFGLRHTYKTKVGNDFVRGVSGGERKRVSIAEALACRGSIYCWDNATRGLDASTALEYARAIRTSTNLLNTTAFVTIYQAGEQIYETFDKVTILYKGKQIYFGPVTEAKEYFVRMGWDCPARQSTAEFLTAVTDPIGRFPKPGFERKVPRTPEEFQAYWINSPEYKALSEEIKVYNDTVSGDETHDKYHTSITQEKMKFARPNSKYTVNFAEQLRLTTLRGFQRIWGDKAYTITLVGAGIAQGLIAGSLYYNTPETVSGAFSRGGSIFFAMLYVSLMGLAEISASFATRPILMKHKNYSMYHPAADAIGSFITSIPVSFFVSVFFVVILYFLANLAREAGKFFICLLFVFLLHLTMSGMFQAIASLNKTVASANAFAGVLVLAALMYSSYIIQRPSMHPWFKWISYINPILYAFEAVIASEFHGRHMECDGTYLVPSGPGYENLSSGQQACAFKGSVLGRTWVLGDDYLRLSYTYRFTHVWRNFGIMIGFLVFFVSMTALGTEFIRPISGGGDRLLFLKGKVPDTIVMPQDKSASEDEEGIKGSYDNELGKEVTAEKHAKNLIFEDLKSKDIFVWKDVDYVIPYDGKERKLLDCVSGYCIPGTLTALMGESGAGKTTLLNTLAQRIDVGTITGDMLVNGKPLDLSFSRRTGYVQQQDIHVSEVTVRESLRFSARLRRSNDVSDAEKLEYVERIIQVLDMQDYADALVGKAGSGLNVEQRKKLSIGVELVAKPSLLLFLDEPTSGLDSQSAWAIVKLLRDLANGGQSILCTIHQPSATLFEEFDRLLLLRKGGQTVYFGDIGDQSRVILDYFERNGARKCGSQENPAEYILEAIGAGATASTNHNWFDVWSASQEKIDTDKERDRLIAEAAANPNESNYTERELKMMNNTYATPYAYQFWYVLERNALTFWRDPEYIASKIFLMTICGLFIGFTFFGLNHTLTGAQNGMFCAFIAVVVSAPVINQIQEKAIKGRELFEGREKLSNTYHWSLIMLTQVIIELPYLIFGATLMFVSLYFPTQADTSGPHAGMFYFTQGIFLQTFAASFGLLVLYLAPDLESAAVMVSLLYTFIVAFSGVVQPLHLMPGFWTFMHKVSPYTYFIQNLVSSVLHGRQIHCSKTELAIFNPPSGQTCQEFVGAFVEASGGYLNNPNATSDCGFCRYKNADQFLLTVSVKYSYRWRNIGFYCVYFIFNVSFLLFLYYFMRFKKINLLGFLKRK